MDRLVVLLDQERTHDISEAIGGFQRSSSGTSSKPKTLGMKRGSSRISVFEMQAIQQKRVSATEERKQETSALCESMDDLARFVTTQGTIGKTFKRGSAFYSYSWQWVMCLQKIIVVIIAMAIPPDSGTVVMGGCLFFMLLVLVVQVDLEPHEWNLLNDVAEVMDIAVVYMIIFAQLAWDGALILTSFFLLAVTVLPVALRLLMPKLPPKQQADGDSVCDAVEKDMKLMFGDAESKVKLAVMSALLANGGIHTLSKAQNRIRERLRQKAEDARQVVEQRKSPHVMPDTSQPMVDIEMEVRPNPSGVTLYNVAATNNSRQQNKGLIGTVDC